MLKKRGFNFFLFAGIGSILPLIGVYLKNELNFSGYKIGIIISTQPLFSFFAQILTGYIIDKTKVIRYLMFLYSVLTILFSFLLYHINEFTTFLVIYGLYSLSTSSLILINNIGIIESDDIKNFGKIRVFGSIGFLISAGITPLIIKDLRNNIFLLSAIFSCIVIFFINSYPKYKPIKEKPKILLKELIVPDFWVILGITFIFQISYASLDTFLSILINSLGYSDRYIGIAWVIGVVSELPVMYFTDKIIKKIGILWFIMIGIISGLIRWTGYYLSNNITPIFILQTLHSFTFSALYNGGIYLSHKLFSEKLVAIGQSLYDSFSRILGYFLGIIIMGIIYEKSGVKQVFLLSSILSFISLSLLTIYMYKRKKRT
ncbi:MAG TPA: MFS transporter [Spirochaetota bacterium]|nr:MFS transporter [Spirochaetota bacterium]HPQ48852.1 MFS transporter [Spirochaetota bacterium]